MRGRAEDGSLAGDAGELPWPDGLSTMLAVSAGRALLARREAAQPAVAAPQRPRGPARIAHQPGWDSDAVAQWLVSQVPPGRFPGVVLGSPHAAAAHLALALGVPWLPASFEVPTPERPATSGTPATPGTPAASGAAAWLADGERFADAVVAANDDIHVRQVYDPVARGWSGSTAGHAVVRWRGLPDAYRDFLANRLENGAPLVVVRDVGRWLVVPGSDRYSFQLGSRASGLPLARAPGGYAMGDSDGGHDLPAREDREGERGVERGFVEDLRQFGSAHGRPVRQVLYRHPDVLSAAVADLYRMWLRGGERTGNRLVVECGRLLEPWHVLRAGLVPYWCEHPLRGAVQALQWWLAGSEPYSAIEVLAEPPGLPMPTMAQLGEWDAVAAFATRRGAVDRRCARAYPLGAVPAHHATSVLRTHPYDLPYLAPIDPGEALGALVQGAQTDGLLVL